MRVGRVLGVLVGALVATAIVLYLVPSGDYILLPDVAHPVAPLVHVAGAKPAAGPGGVYFVDVFERRASELESLFPWLHSQGTLEPANAIVPPCSNDAQEQRAAIQQMALSQRIAAAVALERLGYKVGIARDGVLVDQVIVGTHAPCKLQSQDRILAVDGTATPTVAKLHAAVQRVRPGQTVTLGVARGAKRLTVSVQTVADPSAPGSALIGVVAEQAARITLPVKVAIDSGNVGGPSAGLAFALEVMQKLGRDVDRGYKVAATGQMELDGTVAPIGGVEQKTYGARKAGVDVFLVPAGDNARDARRYAGGLRVIAVKTFPQALHALATLPRKG